MPYAEPGDGSQWRIRLYRVGGMALRQNSAAICRVERARLRCARKSSLSEWIGAVCQRMPLKKRASQATRARGESKSPAPSKNNRTVARHFARLSDILM